MEKELKTVFDKYDESFKKFGELLKDEEPKKSNMPQKLSQFNIRIKLAIDIQISFKNEVARTTTERVRATYELFIKLMESWNAYDVLRSYALSKDKDGIGDKYTKPKPKPKSKPHPYNPFLDTVLVDSDSRVVLHSKLESLKSKCKEDAKFNNKFKDLLVRFKDDENIGTTLKDSCQNLINYFYGSDTILEPEILALIYTTRNMYYHNGEVAGKDLDYGRRIILMRLLISCLQEYMLLLATYIIEKEIAIKINENKNK